MKKWRNQRHLRVRGIPGGIKSPRLPRIDHLHVQGVKVPDVAGCYGKVMGFRGSRDKRIAQVQHTAGPLRVCPKSGCPLCASPFQRQDAVFVFGDDPQQTILQTGSTLSLCHALQPIFQLMDHNRRQPEVVVFGEKRDDACVRRASYDL